MIERKLAPLHIGNHIREELEYLNVSANRYAKLINVSPSTVTRVLNGEAGISAEMAVKLAATIGSTPEQWLRMQADYDLWFAKENVDVSGFTKIGETEIRV